MTMLHDLTRAARRARKRHAVAASHYAEAETAKARHRAERRTKAARRSMLEAARVADAWADFADA